MKEVLISPAEQQLSDRIVGSVASLKTKMGRIAATGLAVAAGAFSTVVVEDYVHPETAAAETLGYPDSQMPCEHAPYNVSGACANYDWGPVHTERYNDPSEFSGRGYSYRNCTDYVAWKLGAMGVTVPRNLGNGGQWYDNAPASERSLTPRAGDAAVVPDTVGHVAYVESVNYVDPNNPLNDNITVSEYNHDAQGHGDVRTGTAGVMGFKRFVDFGVHPSGGTTSNANNLLNQSGDGIAMPGHWIAGDSGQDFAYVTRRPDDGFDIAMWEQTPSGIVWKGVMQTVLGSSGVTFENTKFIATDMDGDGLMDIYYATSTNPGNPGFAMGLLHNNGNGLNYWGTQWTPNNIALAQTRFLPGDWAGNGRGAFDYVTKNADGGFSLAEFKSTANGLVWDGVKWTSPGSSGVGYDNTKFVAADMDGDGKTDLYYATSLRPSQAGFSMALMHNNGSGFDWWGSQWNPNNLALQDVRMMPGYWTGTNREGFAYASKNPDGGFSMAVQDSTPSGLVWKGVWMASPGSSGVGYDNTVFVPADMDNDGKTDLFYATALDWSKPGFSTALMHNTGNGLEYLGQQWDPTNLALGQLALMPQR